MALSQIEVSRMPASMPAPGPRPDANFIKNLEKALIERYRPRNQDFQTLVNAWHGVYYDNQDTRYDMDTIGRPLLRVQDSRVENVPETLNVLKGFADAYKRMLVHLPDIRIPRPAGRFGPDINGQKQSEEYQGRMKRAGYGIWDASQMEIQQVAAAFWLATCGSVGMIVVPDFERGHATVQYVAPWDIYGVGKVDDDFALSRCIIAVDQDVNVVQSTYGEKVALGGTYMSDKDFMTAASTLSDPGRTERTIRHSIYYDEHWFVRMIGNRVVGEVKHDLGFCPALVAPFILLPQYVNRGASPIEQLLPMQLSINFAVTLWEEGFKDSVLPTTWVRNANQIPANFARGRGQLISIGENGDIGELGGRSAEAMRTVSSHVDLMIRFMELNSGVSRPQLEGRLAGGGPTSGRGLEKSQGPYLAGVEEIQNTQGFFMGKALKMAFDMTSDPGIWDDEPDAKVHFAGTFPGTEDDFYEEFTREELKSVPTPDMSYSPMAHLGMNERLTMVLQMLGSKPPLISWDAAVDMIGIVKDHPNVRAEIESDLKWRLEIMQQEISAQQGGQGGGQQDAMRTAASAAAGATNPGTMQRAGVGQTPPAEAPTNGAPPPTGAIPSGGSPTGAQAVPVSTPAAPPGGGGSAPGGSAQLPPDVVAKMQQGAPESPPESAAPKMRAPLAQQLSEELGGLRTQGDIYVAGQTVFVEWKDKAKVQKLVAHHKGVTVKVVTKDHGNVPKNAEVVKRKGFAGGGKDAGNDGRQQEHLGADPSREPQAQP